MNGNNEIELVGVLEERVSNKTDKPYLVLNVLGGQVFVKPHNGFEASYKIYLGNMARFTLSVKIGSRGAEFLMIGAAEL